MQRKLRSVQKGLRPPFYPSQDTTFSPKVIEKMGEMLEEALRDNVDPDERLSFIIQHAHIVALFRRTEGPEHDQLFTKSDRSEGTGCELGFTVEEIRGLNRFIIEQDLAGHLDSLFQKLEKKVGAK